MKILNTIINRFAEKYDYPNLYELMTEFILLRNVIYEKTLKAFDVATETDTLIKEDVITTWSEDQVAMALTDKTVGAMAKLIDETCCKLDSWGDDADETYNNAYYEIAGAIMCYDTICFSEAFDGANKVIFDVNTEFAKIVLRGTVTCCAMIYVSEDICERDDIAVLKYIRENFDAVMARYAEIEEEESNK